MKILVTGGAGFIGSHLVDSLLEQNNEVFIIDNLSNSTHEFVNKKAGFSVWSVLDFELEKSFDEFKPDAVVHLAAQTDVTTSVREPIIDAQENILGMINVLELSVKYNVKKLVFSSSGGAIYGEAENLPADENSPVLPMSPYGTAKYSCEEYIRLYSRLYDLNYSILRFSNVYGPRQKPADEGGVVAIFAMNLLKDIRCRIFGSGEQTRDFVFVQDVVDGIINAINCKENCTVNISTGKETSVNHLYNLMTQATSVSTTCKYEPARKGEVLRNVLSNEKAKSEIGFNPSVAIEDGVKKTIDFFKERVKK
jgi:UDP-glucose 4-epimerase